MKQAAFTLIEILIVVILLGILAAIIIPQFTDAADDANAAAQDTDIASLQSLLELYNVKEGGYPANLGLLVTAGYTREVPTNPVTGAAYGYTAATGTVTAAAAE